MLKPSDFNNAVPQFQNGNYASNPINPQYVEEPSSTDYNRGTEPLQTLPAQWWNWFINKFTSRFNKVNIYVKNLFNELAQLLSLVNVTPDGTEGAVTDGQLKNAFKELYPDYINTKLALESTYVKKTQKVNNHALSGDVTVTKSDVGLGNVPNVSTNDQTPTYTEASTLTALSSGEKLSIAFGKLAKAVSSLISHINNTSNPHSVTKAQVQLGNVVNTGDSATPVENGTTKFTTGGAYTLKKDLTDIAESLPTDAVLHYSFDEVPDYPDGTAVYFRNNNFTSIDFNTYGTTASIVNNQLKLISNGNQNYLQIYGVYLQMSNINNKILILRFKTSDDFERVSLQNIGGSYAAIELPKQKIGDNEYIVRYATGTFSYDQYITFGFLSINSNNAVTISALYIGDGSYSTPVIDNANGQWNSVSQSGVAVSGVSGKGLKLYKGNYVDLGDFNFSDDFSVSIWVNPENLENGNGTIFEKSQAFVLLNGGNWTGGYSSIHTYIYIGDNTNYFYGGTLLPSNTWTHLVLTKSGTSEKIYKNGSLWLTKTLSGTAINKNSNHLTIGNATANKNQSYDDLLIFDRALSDIEVKALYYNKANTPKYYGDVPVTRKISGHTLEEDIAITKADVGLGNVANKDLSNVVNTGDSATPTSGGTTKFTTGGAYTELAKKVDKTTKVNGHALSGNVTVTKGDVGLGSVANKDLSNVVNTGDSATPVSGGTTKFTTGGAYNLLTSLAPIFSTATSYAVGDLVTYNGQLYTCTTAHSAGAWNASHFTVANLNTEFQKPANNIIHNFTTERAYTKDELVMYNKELYKCKESTYEPLSEWDPTVFDKVQLFNTSTYYKGEYVLNIKNNGVGVLSGFPDLPAGSILTIRASNQNTSKSGDIELTAHHNYKLGIVYSDGNSEYRTINSGDRFTFSIQALSYREIRINYIEVDGISGDRNFNGWIKAIPATVNSL